MKVEGFKERFLFILTLIFVVLDAIVIVYLAKIIEKIVDTAVSLEHSEFIYTMQITIGYLFFTLAVEVLLHYIKQSFIKVHIEKLRFDLIRATLNAQDNRKYASLTAILNNVNMYRDDYVENFFGVFSAIPKFLFATILLYSISKIMLLVGVLLATLPLIFSFITRKYLDTEQKNYVASVTPLTNSVKEMLDGLSTIKSFGAEDRVENNMKSIVRNNQISKFRINFLLENINSINSFIGNLIFVVVITIGAYFSMRGIVSVGVLVSSTQLINHIVTPFINTSKMLNHLNSFKTIKEDLYSSKNILSNSIDVVEHKFNREIELENVSFCYDDGVKLLNNVSHKFYNNKKYAIIGKSGSGKSILLQLLSGRIKPIEGEIKFDGISLNEVSQSFYYKNMSFVHQDIFLFDDSIFNNITFYNQYSDEEIKGAMSFAEIDERFKDVSESSKNISGGEKQMISIARAVIQNKPILLLDEFRSSIDELTANRIEDRILKLDKLVINVTHQIDGDYLRKYDEIIIFKDGKIVDYGTFDDLIERSHYFKGLYYLNNR